MGHFFYIYVSCQQAWANTDTVERGEKKIPTPWKVQDRYNWDTLVYNLNICWLGKPRQLRSCTSPGVRPCISFFHDYDKRDVSFLVCYDKTYISFFLYHPFFCLRWRKSFDPNLWRLHLRFALFIFVILFRS